MGARQAGMFRAWRQPKLSECQWARLPKADLNLARKVMPERLGRSESGLSTRALPGEQMTSNSAKNVGRIPNV